MKLPKMIIFDYGHTLVYEPEEQHKKGAEVALSHAHCNPKNITAEELNQRGKELFDEQAAILRVHDLEVNKPKLDMLLYDMLGLKFDITPEELEYKSWMATESIYPMEGIGELLEFLKIQGIRTGVISNIDHSGTVLARRINETLPMNKFEFILASSEYLYRKPKPYMFEVAIAKSGLNPEEIWFCGDNIVIDIEGANAVGIFPVWYESPLKCVYQKQRKEKPECDHIHIRSWRELIEVIQRLVGNE